MMTTLEAIKKIRKTQAQENVKEALSLLASEFDLFLQLHKKHKEKGLMKACFQNIGVKFLGMYNIWTLNDIVKKAENNNLLY